MSDNKPIMQAKTQHGHSHKEAFCVMQYQCSECEHEERIWNSRDGVTPFGLECPKCHKPTLTHVNFHLDLFSPFHMLMMKAGDRFFIDMTMDKAREYAVRNVDRFIEAGRLPASARNYKIGEVAKSYYHEGNAPDIAVKV